MWSKEIFGSDVYHLVSAFIVYSILGWAVESLYMSFCNKKITNRGFGTGPYCPIYGFGGVVGYLILHPLKTNYIKLYLAGALLATVFEYLVGIGMQKIFGEVWWDYNNKKMNYKGIICLESTIAWGFYAVIIICVLNNKVLGFIDKIGFSAGIIAVRVIVLAALVDYIHTLYGIIEDSKEEEEYKRKSFREKCLDFVFRRN